jgi:hypothetical protein
VVGQLVRGRVLRRLLALLLLCGTQRAGRFGPTGGTPGTGSTVMLMRPANKPTL